MSAPEVTRGRTAFWKRRRAERDLNPDALVAIWKAAWTEGAEAQWTGALAEANPHAGAPAHAAWDAGWHWAEHNPDRRISKASLLAHPRRRATDVTPHLTRAVQVGAVGLTLFGLTRSLRRWLKRPGSKSGE